jgi:hypothetical protein
MVALKLEEVWGRGKHINVVGLGIAYDTHGAGFHSFAFAV